jgi:hypothetical protein
MGFRAARARLVQALREGCYEHEARDALGEKNLLAVGEVTAAEVIRLLLRCKGHQFRRSLHHFDPTIDVFEFTPDLAEERWYVKAYFVSTNAVLISVHPAD